MKPIINVTKDGFLEIEHPVLGPQKTRLSADVAADATSSTVESYVGYAADDYVVFGHLGEELTEIVLLTSVTADVTLGHTTGPIFAHSARTPVPQIPYNQVEIYTSTTETGTYSLLTTIDLQVDQEKTIYDATVQVTTTWFKARFKNVKDATTSTYSDVVVYTGYDFQTLHSMTDEILEEFEDPDASEVSRNRIRILLRAGVRKLVLELIKTFPDYRFNYTTQDLTANTALYDLPTRFLAFQRVDVNFSGTTASQAHKTDIFEREQSGQPDTTYYESDPRIFFRTTQFGIRPTPGNSSGRAFLWYWDYPAEMDDEADVHGLPYGGREPLVQYVLWRLWRPKNRDRASDYKADYRLSKEEYIDFVGQRKQVQSKPMVQAVFGSDLYDDSPHGQPI